MVPELRCIDKYGFQQPRKVNKADAGDKKQGPKLLGYAEWRESAARRAKQRAGTVTPTAENSDDELEKHADEEWFVQAMGGGGTRDPRRAGQIKKDG